MKLQNIKNKKGLTLVEIIAATTIMAITFVAFMSLFTQSSRISGGNSKKTDMVSIAQTLMEQSCKEDGYASLKTDGLTDRIDAIYKSKYNADRVVDYVPSGLVDTGLKKITVRVWEADSSDPDSGVILVTMLSNA